MIRFFQIFMGFMVWGSLGSVFCSDWPQFRGPNADGISGETGLIVSWPESGPVIRWRHKIGEGFSGISVVGKVFYTGDSTETAEYIIKGDNETGTVLWRQKIAGIFEDSWGNGPRSTPAVDGNSLFVMSSEGLFCALDTRTGQALWVHDIKKEFGVETPRWGFCMSPLVIGDRVILEIGASEQRSVAAFEKETGKLLWTSGQGGSAYGSPLPIRFEDQDQILFLNDTRLQSISPQGEVLWQYMWKENNIKPASPIFVPPNVVIISAAYGVGAAAIEISPAERGIHTKELWQNNTLLRNHFTSSLTLDGFVYGFDNATMKCLDPKTGKQHWAQRGGLGKGSLIAADGKLFLLTEMGKFKLLKASSGGYQELASTRLFEDRCWTAPSLSNGMVYIRNLKEIMCLDVRLPQRATLQKGG